MQQTIYYHMVFLIILASAHETAGVMNKSLRSVWSLDLAVQSSSKLTVETHDVIDVWPGRLFDRGFQKLTVIY